MAIKSIDINVFDSVENNATSDWTKARSNTGRKTLQDRKAPSIVDTGGSVSGAVSYNQSTRDSVFNKVNTNNVGAITKSLTKGLNVSGLGGEAMVVSNVRNNMVTNITSKLTAPGLPLNIKNNLNKAIDKICSSGTSLSMDFNLSFILSGFGLDELMRLIACLSDPIKLANVAISMLTGSLPSSQIESGFNTLLSTGQVDTRTALGVTTNRNGLNILKTNKGILSNFNNNVNSDELSNVESNTLYNTLPKDDDSMPIYASNKDGLFTKINNKQNNTKDKQSLSLVPNTIDESSKNSIYIDNFKEDRTRPRL